MNDQAEYSFSEVTNLDELEPFFRLRYNAYLQNHNHVFVHKNDHHLDVDIFDSHSRHFTISIDREVACYLRCVLPPQSNFNERLYNWALDLGIINKPEDYWKCEPPYPFLSYENVPKSHHDFYQKLISEGGIIGEGSRLVTVPKFRSMGLSRFLIECVSAKLLFIEQRKICIVTNSDIVQKAFYESFGFRAINNDNGFIVKNIHKITVYLHLSDSSMPKEFFSRLEKMAKEFDHSGCIKRLI